ncbi:hypothetical protein Nepgr_028159 [Nepenthes gracilis]|uniref:Uncharacterized protein n=1 Tax=Nepenthes gracilis TaxID=150966 RepID=A0AAD3TCL8_NEPGR|nr:hypothetical protein Nepgr_028159 [Nepenthes gracilis]
MTMENGQPNFQNSSSQNWKSEYLKPDMKSGGRREDRNLPNVKPFQFGEHMVQQSDCQKQNHFSFKAN